MGKKSWGGGKGDESRVSNHKAYRDSPLWNKKHNTLHIEGVGDLDPIEDTKISPKMDRYKPKYLFLDDQRMPEGGYLWDEHITLFEASGIKYGEWAIVRSYEQFVEYIEKNGIPDVVSFDNDLFDVTDHRVSVEDLAKQLMMENWKDFPIKTGAHCAQYLVNTCVAQCKPIPKYYVHSANNKARPIIRKILNDAIQGEI